MKFSVSFFALALMPLLAVAMPGGSEGSTPTPASQCSTGPVQCCNSVDSSSSFSTSTLLSSLGIVPQGVNVPIGLTCTPISVVGIGSGATCNSQAVCCENNSFNGVVAIGCSPVNINL